MNFNKFHTFIFDLDGTVWAWTALYPGVIEKIERLQHLGKQILFTTNNTLLSTAGLLKKLRGFGIDVNEDSLVTAGFSAVRYLWWREEKVLAFGDGVRRDLKRGGVKLTNSADCGYIIIGHDQAFNLEKLALAKEAIKSGAKLLTTSRAQKWVCGEKLLPGTGAVVEMVESYCKEKAKLLGKPSDFFAKLLWSRVTSLYNETVLIGDSCKEDIAMGKKLGFYTVLVLTGMDKKPEKKIKPHLVLGSVADMKI